MAHRKFRVAPLAAQGAFWPTRQEIPGRLTQMGLTRVGRDQMIEASPKPQEVPHMSIRSYGPFRINGRNSPFCTIFVNSRDGISVTAPASDRVFLGGLNGEVGPEGRPERAGPGYPAPGLPKYSLIFGIRAGVGTRPTSWLQGGSNPATFLTTVQAGQVIIHINDDNLADNEGGWNVMVTRAAIRDITDLPRPGSSALVQGADGNMRLVATGNRTPSIGTTTGNLQVFHRDRSFNWSRGQIITNLNLDHHATREEALLFPFWFQATDGHFWGVCLQGSQVKYFADEGGERDVPGANNCIGAPAMIQLSSGRYGNRGHFALVYPTRLGFTFRFANNNSRSCNVRDPLAWMEPADMFGDASIQVQAVRLLESREGLEVIASGRTGTGMMQLQQWRRYDTVDYVWRPWRVLVGSEALAPGSLPAFFQSTLRSASGQLTNFYHVIAPAQRGGLLHWSCGTDFDWREPTRIAFGNRTVRAVHVIQSDFGRDYNNFELVAETGEADEPGRPGVGYGSFLFGWCDNYAATVPAAGVWHGPFPLSL